MLSDVVIPLFDIRQEDQVGAYESALDLLAEATPQVDVMVPGHGAVAKGPEIAARLAADRAYIDALRERMPDLEYLSLIGTRVSDAGLAHISHLKKLKTIYLDDSPNQETNVTDGGLVYLGNLKNLRLLTFGRKVTSTGVESLRKALPKTTILTFRP